MTVCHFFLFPWYSNNHDIPMVIPIYSRYSHIVSAFQKLRVKTPHPNAAFQRRPRPRNPGRDIAKSSRQPLGEWERNILSWKNNSLNTLSNTWCLYIYIIYYIHGSTWHIMGQFSFGKANSYPVLQPIWDIGCFRVIFLRLSQHGAEGISAWDRCDRWKFQSLKRRSKHAHFIQS